MIIVFPSEEFKLTCNLEMFSCLLASKRMDCLTL